MREPASPSLSFASHGLSFASRANFILHAEYVKDKLSYYSNI